MSDPAASAGDRSLGAAMVVEVEGWLAGASVDAIVEQVDFLVLAQNAMTCRLLMAARELERRGVLVEDGCRDLGQWLAWRCGLTTETGARWAACAAGMEGLPGISARF